MYETCSEGCEDDIVALLQLLLEVPESESYRGG